MNIINKNFFANMHKCTVATLCILCAMFFMASGCGKFNSSPEDGENEDLEAATDFYYYENGEKATFNVRSDRVILKCKYEDEAKALSEESFFTSAYIVEYVWVITTINPSKVKLDDLLKRPDVVSATCGLEYADGTMQFPTDRIYVKFKEGLSPENVLNDTGLVKYAESITLFNKNHNAYMITLNIGIGDILQMCRDLFESGLFKCVEPLCKLEMNFH